MPWFRDVTKKFLLARLEATWALDLGQMTNFILLSNILTLHTSHAPRFRSCSEVRVVFLPLKRMQTLWAMINLKGGPGPSRPHFGYVSLGNLT